MIYDIAGNVVSSADGNGNVTTYGYDDDPNNQNTYARLTSITNALQQKTTMYYDTGTGKLRYVIDPNAVTTTYEYNDPLDRLTHMDRGGTHTNYVYNGPTQVFEYDMQTANWDMWKETDYDGLGRPIASKTYENASDAITTLTSYDGLGRVQTVSNPMRAADALNVTTYTYDALGRTKSVVTPDGSPTLYSYSGWTTTVTDPANKIRQYGIDALGRLGWVIEDPSGLSNSNPQPLNLPTNYGYDPLGDLINVNQSGQTRTFSYDSLGRLKSAANPESGIISYQYDNANNLTAKTDARGIITNYAYDVLNRVTGTTYSDGTPAVTYTYDTAPTYGLGRLAQVANSISTTSMSYDALGRVVTSQQTTDGQSYSFSYGYNYAGALVAETYPSGRVLTTGYDPANRATGISGTLNGGVTNYAASATYAAHGGLAQVWYGNTLVDNYAYNNRLQVSSFSTSVNNNGGNTFLVLQPQWGTTNNNGNLQGMEEYNGGLPLYPGWLHFTQSYLYDEANRLTYALDSSSNCSPTANYACWFRSYQYDAWGNRWVTNDGGVPVQTVTPTSNVYNANNRMSMTSYDAAGNQTTIGATGLQYDAENRQKSATNPPAYGGGTVYYQYDGDGRRVEKAMDSGLTVYVYDTFGDLAAEYTNFPNPSPPCATCYLTHDHLGSTRMVTDQAANLVSRHDFLPFGEEIQGGAVGRDGHFAQSDNVKQLFTGKERDAETGLDYFGARYYGGAMGRFTSPDEFKGGIVDPFTGQDIETNVALPYADITDPQTLNKYAYVRNNPLRYTDPNGHCIEDLCIGETIAVTYATTQAIQYLQTPQGQQGLQAIGQGIIQGAQSLGSALSNVFHAANNGSSQQGQSLGPGNSQTQPEAQSGGQNNPAGPTQPKSNPMQDQPGSTSTTTQPDGTPKQTREYGSDGYPKTDVDYGHDHGQGDPHAHDWGRPSDGSPPTHVDRAPGRPVQPSDPKPNL